MSPHDHFNGDRAGMSFLKSIEDYESERKRRGLEGKPVLRVIHFNDVYHIGER